jgi:DNA-binding beta-propeller fold protein YncE
MALSMSPSSRKGIGGASASAAALAILSIGTIWAQAPVVSPVQALANWAKLPEPRQFGTVAAISVDRSGNVWAFERCGADTCENSKEPPILEFDPSGKLIGSFGAGMFVFPHAIFIDGDDNVWVADANGNGSKGHTVVKFDHSGAVLLTLGKPGVTGDGADTFNRPSGVVVSPQGDIFVSDGHGRDSNARIVKFSKDGKFVKAWGKRGSGPGEFDTLHGIAMDSRGRLFVADRENNRIQIFDQNGTFLDQWTQFSRPTAIFIDAKDTIYVTDNTSSAVLRPDWPRRVRIGSVRDGSVTGTIDDPDAEGIAADQRGNVYTADVAGKMVRKFVAH